MLMSKTTKHITQIRFHNHLIESGFWKFFQFANYEQHSTETVLLKLRDILGGKGSQNVTLLFILDLTAANDSKALHRLSDRLGIPASTLDRIKSDLTDQNQYIKVSPAIQPTCMCIVKCRLHFMHVSEVQKTHLL